jgi:hypothetical protein
MYASAGGSLKLPRTRVDFLMIVPKAYVPDLVASQGRRIVLEIYGAKSSVRDPAKMKFYTQQARTGQRP